jgi:hypothetical protein
LLKRGNSSVEVHDGHRPLGGLVGSDDDHVSRLGILRARTGRIARDRNPVIEGDDEGDGDAWVVPQAETPAHALREARLNVFERSRVGWCDWLLVAVEIAVELFGLDIRGSPGQLVIVFVVLRGAAVAPGVRIFIADLSDNRARYARRSFEFAEHVLRTRRESPVGNFRELVGLIFRIFGK